VANELAANNYDAIYASSMIRTQETAAPLADLLGLPIVVLPGLREIDAGVF
jgi:broad specificity phosphatase PhoE